MKMKTFIPLQTRIFELVKEFKVLRTEQIQRYFKGCPIESINHAIKSLKMDGRIYQSQSNTLTSINRAYADVYPEEATESAFYVLASFGYENIAFFDAVKFPKQIIFVANNNLYEVTVMTHDNETILKALLQQEMYQNKEDAVNLIVVDSHEKGKEMLASFGFDAYCILNQNNEPAFYQE